MTPSAGTTADDLNAHLSHLVGGALEALAAAGCITYDQEGGGVAPTTAGRCVCV